MEVKMFEGATEIYNAFVASLPSWMQSFVGLFLLAVLVMLYAFFIWKFYRFIATKNILNLNLNKYNKSENPFITKLFAGILYFIEYIIILPFIIFFWFAVFTLFLILLTENLEVSSLLLISAVIIAAIRMTSYINENLSKEVAKLLPFTLLAVSILTPHFFDIGRVLSQISQIPLFFGKIINYLLFIIILEVILRFFEFIFSLFELHEEIPEKISEEKN